MRVLDLASKDLLQIVRDWRAALFLVFMPIAFTLMFGFAFGGFGGDEPDDLRLPVGILDQDQSALSSELSGMLTNSKVIRIESGHGDVDEIGQRVSDGELAAALIVPSEFHSKMVSGEGAPVRLIADSGSSAGFTVQGEVQGALVRLSTALRAARIGAETLEKEIGFETDDQYQSYFDRTLKRAIAGWEEPPITVTAAMTGLEAGGVAGSSENAFAQSSPGMMAQFAIAGLMGASAILVLERKSRSLQRLLTTTISRAEILLGHYLAMFTMIFVQITILIVFGQLLLKLDYFNAPVATLLLATTTALFAASLGLLIGAIARTQDQVVIIALISMFVLAGLGGAWVPLEMTPEGFQRVAHFTPVAWIMDGYKDILIRGLGLEAVLPSAGVLVVFTAVIFALAVWRFRFE